MKEKEYTEEEIQQMIIDNACYQVEIADFNSRTKEEQEQILKETEEQINKMSDRVKNLVIKKKAIPLIAIVKGENILHKELTSEIIEELLQERSRYIEEGMKFFRKKDFKEALEEWGGIIPTDTDNNYQITDFIIDSLLQKNGFKIESKRDRERIESIIYDLWENQKEIITKNKIDELSKQKNGLNFKEFLFCEEYIKTGKVKKTSEALGIGRTTCYDYLNKAEVKEYLEATRKEIAKEGEELMKQGFRDCFEELQSLVKSFSIQNQDKIRAIDTYLKHYEASIYKSEDK
jgi:hypothetical protein